MARRKRNSKELDKARQRLTNLKSIAADLDLGNGLTAPAYQAEIDRQQAQLDHYNRQLSEIDALLNDLNAQEKVLAALNERMLEGVGVKYGKDSNEYEQAGGTRKSDYKKSSRKARPLN